MWDKTLYLVFNMCCLHLKTCFLQLTCMFKSTTASEVHTSRCWKLILLHMKTVFHSSISLVQRGYAENLCNVWISCVIRLKIFALIMENIWLQIPGNSCRLWLWRKTTYKKKALSFKKMLLLSLRGSFCLNNRGSTRWSWHCRQHHLEALRAQGR